jgi:hypothetical protein
LSNENYTLIHIYRIDVTLSGEFEGTIFFLPEETFSILFGERCHKNDPKIIELIIFREDKKAIRQVLHEKDFKVSVDKEERLIQLPEIQIWK